MMKLIVNCSPRLRVWRKLHFCSTSSVLEQRPYCSQSTWRPQIANNIPVLWQLEKIHHLSTRCLKSSYTQTPLHHPKLRFRSVLLSKQRSLTWIKHGQRLMTEEAESVTRNKKNRQSIPFHLHTSNLLSERKIQEKGRKW